MKGTKKTRQKVQTTKAASERERGYADGRTWSVRGARYETVGKLSMIEPDNIERKDPLWLIVDRAIGNNLSDPSTSLWFSGKKRRKPHDAYVEGFLDAVRETWLAIQRVE